MINSISNVIIFFNLLNFFNLTNTEWLVIDQKINGPSFVSFIISTLCNFP